MFKKLLSKHDIYLSAVLLALLILGLFTLYSSTKGTGIANEQYFSRQLIFAIIGLIFYFFISFVNLKFLESKIIIILLYLFTIVLLVAVLLFTAKVKGASRWFVLPVPVLGSINIQPADIAKLLAIIIGSFLLTEWNSLKKFIKIKTGLLNYEIIPYLIVSIPILTLVLIQPALGTTIIIFLTLTLMLYFSSKSKFKTLSYLLPFVTVSLIWILLGSFIIALKVIISFLIVATLTFLIFKKSNKIIIICLFIIATVFSYTFSQPNIIDKLGEYQKDRINCWINSNIDIQGICYQQIQSRVAIGSGELFGRGFSQGLQVQEANLPEFQNDFIYAAFAEQYGFIGTIFLLSIFFLFICEIIRLSTSQKSEFSRLIILGIAMVFILQVFINIAMNNGLLPTTGISLPFMSYGGSFLWISLISVGIVQNLSHNSILITEKELKYERWDD